MVIVDPFAAAYAAGFRLVSGFRQRADGPPKDWAPTHHHALTVTVTDRHRRSGASIRVNRPVPRLASHHYVGHPRDSRDVYFP